MALPFINGAARKRDQLLSIDLGGRTTKAVHLQRKGQQLVLSRFALLDAPIYERTLSPELLSEHLKAVCQALEAKTKWVSLAIGVNDALVRHAELPQMPVADMRQVLKNNSKTYLQQELTGHVFDCFPLLRRPTPPPPESAKAPAGNAKQRVLVASARKQLTDDLQEAVKNAGLTAYRVVPGMIGPVNALEQALPEVFAREAIALVDIGFKNTTICLLSEGELVLSRVVAIGGDKLTAGLAEALGITYAEAEGIKVGMASEVHSHLEGLVLPLGRELRASIDFFEHQQEKTVTQLFLSGASAQSESIVRMLQAELLMECKLWNPLGSIEPNLPPAQTTELERVAPHLSVALGAALAAF